MFKTTSQYMFFLKHIRNIWIFSYFEENGFDYLPKIGCSIQRSDASTTLRQICHLAKELDFNVSIFFEWKDHEEAAYPAESACLELIPLSKGIDK